MLVAASIAVAGLLSASPAAATGETVTNGPVTWTVIEETKQIQVEVTLAFFPSADDRDIDPATFRRAVERIKASIENVWDGQAFGCYHLAVKLTTSIVPAIDDVGKGEIPIRLTSQLMALGNSLQAFVQGKQGVEDHESDSPTKRFDPYDGEHFANNPSHTPSTFSMLLDDAAYAHEFGHVLGLDDSYERGSFGGIQLRKGAVPDLMFRATNQLSAVSVARAVRRSGLDEELLRCNVRYVLPASQIFPYTPGNNIAMDLTLCDMPAVSGDWDVRIANQREREFMGTVTGGFDLGALGEAAGGGRVSGMYHVTPIGGSRIYVKFSFLDGEVTQIAEYVGDIIATDGPPKFEGSTLPIIGPAPSFTPEPEAMECL